ncbi:MAG: hypothetical protein DRG11_01110 [Epsilonproteobacteria bacterium]|nr:MAG: hypothetical protein DRG11_01110 [Campylobacterota bacterium]
MKIQNNNILLDKAISIIYSGIKKTIKAIVRDYRKSQSLTDQFKFEQYFTLNETNTFYRKYERAT